MYLSLRTLKTILVTTTCAVALLCSLDSFAYNKTKHGIPLTCEKNNGGSEICTWRKYLYLFDSDGEQFLFYPEKLNGNNKLFWLMMNTPKKKTSNVTLISVNCRDKSYKIEHVSSYRDVLLQGEAKSKTYDNPPKNYTPPGSNLAYIINMVCSVE